MSSSLTPKSNLEASSVEGNDLFHDAIGFNCFSLPLHLQFYIEKVILGDIDIENINVGLIVFPQSNTRASSGQGKGCSWPFAIIFHTKPLGLTDSLSLVSAI